MTHVGTPGQATPTGTTPHIGAHGRFEGKTPQRLLASIPRRRPRLLKEVAARQTSHLRELSPEVRVRGQAVDHLGAPALAPLAFENLAPDLPAEPDEPAKDRGRGAGPRGRDPGLDLGGELGVV